MRRGCCLVSATLLAFLSPRHVTVAVPSETTVAMGAELEGNCGVLHHVFIQNGTHGVVVAMATSTEAGRNSNTSRTVPGAHLPPECGPTYAQCNTTVIYPGDGNLTLLVPVMGGVLLLTYWYDPGAGWSPTVTEPCILEVRGNCNPVAVGHIQDSMLSVLCLDWSAPGGHFGTLLLTLDATDACQSSLTEVGVFGHNLLPSLSNPILIQVLANCPLLSVVTAVVAFADGDDVFMASMSQTAAQPFLKVPLSGNTCPMTSPILEYYGGDMFLLRCSTEEALTFDPCHQLVPHVANHSVSIPYPCSTWDVVAWMYPTNNSIVVHIGNRTVTWSIVGSMSEASCVNPKDPHFVYRSANSSVYVIRVQDGRVTMLGTSRCSGLSSSPALCSGLDFTEHEGSFFVEFFDGFTYKTANLSCPGNPLAVVGVAFPPDLSTSFVGPDEQSCLCSPQPPTHPLPAWSFSPEVIAGLTISAIVTATVIIALLSVLGVMFNRKKCNKQYEAVSAQSDEEASPETETLSNSSRVVTTLNSTMDSEHHPINVPAFPESRKQQEPSVLAM